MKNIFCLMLITANLVYAMDQEEPCGALKEQSDKERASSEDLSYDSYPSVIYSCKGVTPKGSIIEGAIVKTSEGLMCCAYEQTSPKTPMRPILSYPRALEVVEFLAGQEYINILYRKTLYTNQEKQPESSVVKFSNNKPALIDIESIEQLPKIYTCIEKDYNGTTIARGYVLKKDNDLVFVISPREHWQALEKRMGGCAAKKIILCAAGRDYLSMLASKAESPDDKEPIVTCVVRPIARELRAEGYIKIASLASEIW